MKRPLQKGAPLTPREKEVLALIAKGLSNKLIADALHLSEHTAKFHVTGVCKKLGAGSRVEAAVVHATQEAFDKGFKAAASRQVHCATCADRKRLSFVN